MASHIDKEGNCKGITFKSDKGTWIEGIVQTIFKIILTMGIAIVNSNDNY